MNAASLIELAYGSALRHVAEATGQHFSGLQAAARYKQLPVGNRLKRQLRQLDIAFSWTRHITQPKVQAFLDELAAAIKTSTNDVTKAAEDIPMPGDTSIQEVDEQLMPAASPPGCHMTEMRINVAGDGATYTKQEFKDYYGDNFAEMWNAAEPTPFVRLRHIKMLDNTVDCISCDSSMNPQQHDSPEPTEIPHMSDDVQYTVISAPAKDVATHTGIADVNTDDYNPSMQSVGATSIDLGARRIPPRGPMAARSPKGLSHRRDHRALD